MTVDQTWKPSGNSYGGDSIVQDRCVHELGYGGKGAVEASEVSSNALISNAVKVVVQA